MHQVHLVSIIIVIWRNEIIILCYFVFPLLFSDADAENPESQVNPLNEDSPASESAAIEEQSPTSDVDDSVTEIKSQVPRIDAINERQLNSTIDKCRHHLNQRQLPAIDVEHNIPVSFIHDTINIVNVERYVPYTILL